MNKNLTELVFILDRSGSMAGLEADTIGGFNSVLKKNRETEGDAIVSTVLFDHERKVIHDRIPIAEVPDMTAEDYQVRGCTALLDAVGHSIDFTEKIQRYMPEDHKPGSTIFVITTDGLENASKEYSVEQVRTMIERKQEEGWEFLFLGANMDAVGEAGRLGIYADRAATYVCDEVGSTVMFDAVANGVAEMRCASVASAPRVSGGWKRKIELDHAKRGR